MSKSHNVVFYTTPSHICPYLPDKLAINAIVDPEHEPTAALYSHLTERGFRRSGSQLYRPWCPECKECIPTRIPVDTFKASRSQKRTWKKNQDLQVSIKQAKLNDEYFDLYTRYLETRHNDGDMSDPLPDDFTEFLMNGWCETWFIEFRKKGRLIAVAVTDPLKKGLSSIYTFFDPTESKRGLGVFALLWQIEYSKAQQLKYVYPGYWIRSAPKMAYKINYQPIEGYLLKRWYVLAK